MVDQLATIRKSHGDRVVEDAIESLGEADRQAVRAMTSVSWVPVRVAQEVKTHIARALGRPPLAFQFEVAQAAARSTLNSVFRMLLRLVSDSALEKRANSLYRRTLNTGSFTAEFSGTQARFVVHDWPNMSEFDQVGLKAGIETALEFTGRPGAVARVCVEGDKIVYLVRWSRDSNSGQYLL